MRHAVARLRAAWRPDGVIAFWAHPDGEAAVRAARVMEVPSAVIVGGSDVLLLAKDASRRRCVRSVLSRADAVVTVSCDLRDHVIELGILGEKVHVWARGIDTSLFASGDRLEARRRLGIPVSRPSLVWVGRMVPVKGLDVLLESCALLRDRGVDYHLYLVGDGPLRRQLMARTEAHCLSAHITFVGPKLHEELPDWYRAADLTLLPSRSEGLPNVLRESLACGTPFVASDVGGIHQIADPDSSLLVPSEDPLSLAHAIAQALTRWGGQGVAIPPGFQSWEESADTLVGIMQPYVTSGPRVCTMKRPTPRLFADRIDLVNSNQQKQAMLQDPVLLGSRNSLGTRARGQVGIGEQAAPNWRRQALRRVLAATLPSRLFLTHGPRHARSVCLTFDDGPDPTLTPPLLDVLRDCGVRATFFVIGEKVERHPDIVRRMALEGHCVGNHSFSHIDPGSTSCRRLLDEVRRTAALLAGLLGIEVRLFRPPHGKLTASKLWRLWWKRQTVVLWNVDPKDYARTTAQEVHEWFERRALQAGDLVLMHDNVPHAIEVTPDLVQRARASGLTFSTVADWLS